MKIKAVLFDLDGTFADTAPDLGYAVNVMRAARKLPPVGADVTRPVASSGARGLLGAGFGITHGHPDYAAMSREFLDIYENNLCRETKLFPDMAELILALESRALLWGIVTNKAERFALPLIQLLGYGKRAACVIGGDTTAHIKPHPAPLMAAARVLNIDPTCCMYVGDDERDVQAGHAARMKTVAVRYGYLNGRDPASWGADAVIATPLDVLPLLTSLHNG